MTKLTIKLNNIDNVKDFTYKITKYPIDMDLTCGSEQRIVDAKSIMGIFTLDLSHNLKLIIHTDQNDQLDNIKEDIQEFIILEGV